MRSVMGWGCARPGMRSSTRKPPSARDSDDPQFGRLDMRPFVADGGQVRARAWFTALQWIRAPIAGPGIGQGGPPHVDSPREGEVRRAPRLSRVGAEPG